MDDRGSGYAARREDWLRFCGDERYAELQAERGAPVPVVFVDRVKQVARRLQHDAEQEQATLDVAAVMEERVFSLQQLRDNPDLRETPERLGHFAWRGKLSILSSLHKLGRKSSVAGQDAAEATKRGHRVLVANYDEDASDSFDRWQKHGAEPHSIFYAGWLPSTEAIEQIVEALAIDYLIIDSLSTWLSGTGEEVPNSWDNVAAQALANRLKRLAVEHDCGVCLIAHAGQNDTRGRIAGTAGYGAAADMLIEVPPPSTIHSVYRDVNYLGRWKEEPMRIAFDEENVFHVVTKAEQAEADRDMGPGPALHALLSTTPDGMVSSEIRTGLKWYRDKTLRILDLLIRQGAVVREGENANAGYVYRAVDGFGPSDDGQRLVERGIDDDLV